MNVNKSMTQFLSLTSLLVPVVIIVLMLSMEHHQQSSIYCSSFIIVPSTTSVKSTRSNNIQRNTILSNDILSQHKQYTHGMKSDYYRSITLQHQQQRISFQPNRMAVSDENDTTTTNDTKNTLPFYLDPNTKGGVLVLMIVLFSITYIGYIILINLFQYNEIDAGIQIGMSFTLLSTILWMSTYLFRVATKDMTYAKQLKDYENAVIAKRLEELDDDEIQALVEEVSKDSF